MQYKNFYRIILFLFFLQVIQINKNDLYSSPYVGFSSLFIGDSLTQIIAKINNYKLFYSSDKIIIPKMNFNIYLALSQFYNYSYDSNKLIPLKINDQTYYIKLNNLNLKHPNYILSQIYKNYFIFFLKRKTLKIINSQHLKKINPLLKNITLDFFNKKLYKIYYQLSIDLKELERLIKNFQGRYGKIKLTKHKVSPKINKIIFSFMIKNILIKLSMNPNSYYNLTKIIEIKENKSKFTNHNVNVEIINETIRKKIQKYQKNVIKNILAKINQKINIYYKKLLETNNKYKNKLRKQKNTEYYFIDQL